MIIISLLSFVHLSYFFRVLLSCIDCYSMQSSSILVKLCYEKRYDRKKPTPRKPLIQPRPRVKEEILERRKKSNAHESKEDSDDNYIMESDVDESAEEE